MTIHPSAVLFQGEVQPVVLPVCDHYAGSEKLMRKSLALQQELGPVFDITLDCEDGAAVGAEREHAELVVDLVNSPANPYQRVGVRLHDSSHPAFQQDIDILVRQAGQRLAYITLPKVHSANEVRDSIAKINQAADSAGITRRIPIHALVETHGALAEAFALAALPQLECLSFGLMDFVSAHHGAIPASAMGSPGQFEHPLVARAMLEIAAACHAHGKVPSHNVTTEIADLSVVSTDATRARLQFGYQRKWSIHPNQVRAIVAAFAPTADETQHAADILLSAQAASWGPIQHAGKLHDRASYRYYWTVLERAHRTGIVIPQTALQQFFASTTISN